MFSCSIVSNSATPWTAARQASLSFTISWSLLKLMSMESMMPSNHHIFCHLLLLLPSIFPSIRVFSNESALHVKQPKYWPLSSASVLLMNMQDRFHLGLTGLISLKPKGLSKVFSKTTIQKHEFFGIQLLYGPTLTSIHDYWKNHSFDQTDLCQQSNVSAF